MKFKEPDGRFTFLSKVFGMIAGALTVITVIGGFAFSVDARHANTIEVAGQFKAIEDSRNQSDLRQELQINTLRLDVLEDRYYRAVNKQPLDQEKLDRLLRSMNRLERRNDYIEQLLLQ